MCTGSYPAELQSRRALPVLGCFISLYCKKPLPLDLLSYPVFISVKAKQSKSHYSICSGGLFLWYGGMSSAQRERGKRIIHTWEHHYFFLPARCNCISQVFLKLPKHRHLKISQAAPCLHMESMLDTDPKTSKQRMVPFKSRTGDRQKHCSQAIFLTDWNRQAKHHFTLNPTVETSMEIAVTDLYNLNQLLKTHLQRINGLIYFL